MSDLVDDLSARAKALPPEQRARLAEELLASLAPDETDVDQAWDAELRRRIEEIDSGSVSLIPADEAYQQVERALRR